MIYSVRDKSVMCERGGKKLLLKNPEAEAVMTQNNYFCRTNSLNPPISIKFYLEKYLEILRGS